MQCIYNENLSEISKNIIPNIYQMKHIKALRLRIGDELLLTNGNGLSAKAIIEINKNEKSSNKKKHYHIPYILKPVEFFLNKGELPFKLGLALPLLTNRERREFALEKAIELGITDFHPLKTDFSQPVKLDYERLKAKSIAAIEQCQRSQLPTIHSITNLNTFLGNSHTLSLYHKIYITDINGQQIDNKINYHSILVIVGPEGGFSPAEINLMKNCVNLSFLKLSDRKLRSETAAIAALSLIVNLGQS